MITVSADYSGMIESLDALSQRQLPFATMKALNACATAFQDAERTLIQKDFIIRRPWVLQGIKIDKHDFATKQNLSVRIHVDDQRDFLGKFESGGTRIPITGTSLVIPLAARSTPQSSIAASLRPKALQFRQETTAHGSDTLFRGMNDTFMIKRPDGSGVILQRLSRKIAVRRRHQTALQHGERHDYALKVLYVLRPSTPVPASLHFEKTAIASFEQNWPTAFDKWWRVAIATANP